MQAWYAGLFATLAHMHAAGRQMRSATTWLGIAGGFLMVLLMGRNFKGAISIGILFVTFISWIPNHEVCLQINITLHARDLQPMRAQRESDDKHSVDRCDDLFTECRWCMTPGYTSINHHGDNAWLPCCLLLPPCM
jgi:hypothetical protein